MKFGYTIVYVSSVTEALIFYKEAFGFETRFLHDSNQYGELDTGSTVLAFASHAMGEMNLSGQYQKTDPHAAPLGIELAFVTENVEFAFSKAVAAGAIAIKPPIEKPWGQVVAYVRAKDGSLIELCSPIGS
ncbi:MAG: VOC family protein [Rhodoferax sp.]|nr:VOC family protein [Rhodoferax sp.]MBP8182542.1 VOC family protein [Rhodoferax sp.]